MDNYELEEGEIEEFSDVEINNASLLPIPKPYRGTHRTPNLQKNLNHSYESLRRYRSDRQLRNTATSKPTEKKPNDKLSQYDMDDYELLLARHQLIRQQLSKVKAQDWKRKKESPNLRKASKVNINFKNRRHKHIANRPNTENLKQGNLKTVSSINENILEAKHELSKDDIENDLELSELRNALLAQTSMNKKSTNNNNTNNPLREQNSKTSTEVASTVEKSSLDIPCNERNTSVNYSGTKSESNPDNMLDKKELKIKNKIEVIEVSDRTQPVNDISSSQASTNSTDNMICNDLQVRELLTTTETQGKGLTKRQRWKMNKKRRKDELLASEATTPRVIITRSKSSALDFDSHVSLSDITRDASHVSLSDITRAASLIENVVLSGRKKKRKRAGKRSRYLAYRAQQKKEIEILQHQQEKLDNYSSVPMDIDDDSAGFIDGYAPLPLIETTEIMPPLPPIDKFQPVPDQTALSMTCSNVAWMPGYVESLNDHRTDSSPTAPLVEKKNLNQEDPIPSDDNEVWALRAHALKSLACKRATRAKEQHKEKKILDGQVTNDKHQSVKPSLSVMLLPPSVSSSTAKKQMNKKVPDVTNYTAPPKHVPVIIQLTKEDFVSDSKEKIDMKLFTQQKTKLLSKRKKSVSDDNLLKDLQSITEKTSVKLKSHRSSIKKEQSFYKKLQADISEKRSLFTKQMQEVKQLQEKLHKAMREKATTRKIYENLCGEFSQVKDRLKKKINVRKNAEEEILRARSIVSVNRLKLNDKGSITEKMKTHISSLIESIQGSCRSLNSFENINEESSQEETDLISALSGSAMNVPERQKQLQKTAADVKTMKKTDLIKLEMELREKLIKYRKSQTPASHITKVSDQNNDGVEKTVVVDLLPCVKNSTDLKNLQKQILAGTLVTQQNTVSTEFAYIMNGPSSLPPFHVLPSGPENLQRHDDTSYDKSTGFYTKYSSPLTRFRSYRLNPYYRTQSRYTILSPTFTHRIDCQQLLCKYDVSGTCNDASCSFWHFSNRCQLPLNEVVKDLVSYDLETFNATADMSNETKRKLLNSFTEQFFQQYQGGMSVDEKLLLLWNQLKETRRSRKIAMYECIAFQKRDWILSQKNKLAYSEEEMSVEHYDKIHSEMYFLKSRRKKYIKDGEGFESQEIRYFSESYNSIEVLKTALSENPSDVQLWLTLSNHYLKKNSQSTNTNESTNVENALSILSQGLEENRDSEQLWIRYLELFSRNTTGEELRELCYQAVMYSATYTVWWTCLNLEQSYLDQQEICTEMIKFVLESDEGMERKSHFLLESVMFVAQLLICRGKLKKAISYISAALGKDYFQDEKEKLNIEDINKYLTMQDRSLLWLSFISIEVFHLLPSCLFKFEETGPGRLIKKRGFLLDWKTKVWNATEEKIRKLFSNALEVSEKSSLSMKNMMILHENFVEFELSLDNAQAAVNHMCSLVKDEPTFVEAWVVVLSLYINHSPMDAVVTMAEDAIHKCEHDVEIVYYYSRWLVKQGMPSIALEKLTKCIHVYFQLDGNEENIPDVYYLYRKVLGLSVPYTILLPTYLPGLKTCQHLTLYYWLCYCLLLKISQRPPSMFMYSSSTDEAFESAVHQYTSPENTKKLWLKYLQHRLDVLSKQKGVTEALYQQLEDLLFRSLSSVHASVVVPHNKQINWKDFSFHNMVLELCLSVIPVEKHSAIYKKAISFMPENVPLALRICDHEFEHSNFEQIRIMCASLLSDHPKCLNLWLMAIKVELKCNCIKEARWLYQRATKELPFCLCLWKNYVSFEIAFSTKTETLNNTLQEIVKKALEFGIGLKEILSNFSIV